MDNKNYAETIRKCAQIVIEKQNPQNMSDALVEAADEMNKKDTEGCSYGHQAEKGEMMEKYSWSFVEDDDIWRNGADSIEDCIHQAKGEADGEDTVYIGENTAFAPSVDAEHVLDELQEQAGDFAGELGYEWDVYDYKTMRKELDELSDGLTAVVLAWLKKHGREPHFYQVDNVKSYPLSQPAEED